MSGDPLTITMLAEIAQLKSERDALAIVIQKLRDGITTCIAYKATPSSELLKIGYGASGIIKRHDAAVLRKAAEHLEGYEYVFNAPPINYAEAHELRLMANELEKSCQP